MTSSDNTLFTDARAKAFERFSRALDFHASQEYSSSQNAINSQMLLLRFIYISLGQVLPRQIFTNPNILIALDKNDLAYRFIQCKPLNLRSDFGTIVCLDERRNAPYVLHKQADKILYYYPDAEPLSSSEYTTISIKFATELLSSSQDVGIQVFSQIAWSLKSLPDLLSFIFHGRPTEIFSVFVTTLAISIVQLLLPLFTSAIFGIVVPQADLKYFTAIILVSIPMVISMSVAFFLRARLLAQLESLIDFRLQAALVNRVLRQPLLFIQSFSVPDFVLRIQGFSSIRKNITNTVLISLFGLIFGTLNLILMYLYQYQLSGYITLVYIVISLLVTLIVKRQRLLSDSILRSETEVFDDTSLLIDAVPQLRSSATEYFFLSKWAYKLRHQSEVNTSRQYLSDSVQLLSRSSYQISMVFVLFIVAYDFFQYNSNVDFRSITGLFPPDFSSSGSFLAFIVAFTSFDTYFSSFIDTIASNIIDSISQWRRSSPLLYQSPELGYRPELVSHSPSGDIRFENVSYSIDGRQILDNISLSISTGQQVGITGPSGSGKSTFIRLISGVILPSSGSVLIDDLPLQDLNLKTLRSSIGVVTQVSIIPSTSIKDFLAPSFSYSDEEVWEALSIACIADEIMNMPMRLQTILSEGATNISGGQRQRLLIAKAMIKRPRILLLDEATSALPEDTQSQIVANIQLQNVTSLSIAHRLDTIRSCDQIHYFTQGRILESGTFANLKSLKHS